MKFSNALIKKGELWLGCKELAKTGSSPCLNEITEYYNGKQTNEPWCAKFVWMVVDKCSKDFRIKNFLPKTASTLTMVNTAESKGIRVDKTPAPGCIFFKTRTGGGHVGFVSQVTAQNVLITLEGNKSNSVAWGKHTNLSGYRFIHVEEMPRLNGVPDEGTIQLFKPGMIYEIYAGMSDEELLAIGGMSLLGLTGVGIYLMVRK